MGIIVGRGSEKLWSSFKAFFGEAVNIPPIIDFFTFFFTKLIEASFFNFKVLTAKKSENSRPPAPIMIRMVAKNPEPK